MLPNLEDVLVFTVPSRKEFMPDLAFFAPVNVSSYFLLMCRVSY
jgi:hypothetical protein